MPVVGRISVHSRVTNTRVSHSRGSQPRAAVQLLQGCGPRSGGKTSPLASSRTPVARRPFAWAPGGRIDREEAGRYTHNYCSWRIPPKRDSWYDTGHHDWKDGLPQNRCSEYPWDAVYLPWLSPLSRRQQDAQRVFGAKVRKTMRGRHSAAREPKMNEI